MPDADPHVLVPFDAHRPKSRLADTLDESERRAFATTMLEDVLAALDRAGLERTVLSTAPLDDAPDRDVPVIVDDRPLTTAVNARLAGDLVGAAEPPVPAHERPVAVVMADLPLVTPGALGRLVAADGDGPRPDVTMAPGLGGGTNALCVRDPAFRVDYHGASCHDHREGARDRGLSVATVDSFRLAVDVDERADLVEILLHGEGTGTRAWLRAAGFELAAGEGRVRVARRSDERA
ncbi:2-phospho-L-lactate guanylyltransferase [Haloglomus litoreum]|uniref:2-phospho-L-lactate guanylyltransferase n=1 Tax=Haloglomus litoreum TaxID=3034026 RepID=UPI0023E80A75|nr:2-phospho-L-lactate guanylyltransferase [Haloglomus sp. DT116]